MAWSRRMPLFAVIAVGMCLLLAACGGAPSVTRGATSGDSTGSGTGAATLETIVVASDANGDGRADVVLLNPGDDLAPLAWRADDAGAAALIESDAGTKRLERRVAGRTPSDLQSGEGIHRLAGSVSGAPGTPYVVLHAGVHAGSEDTVFGPPDVESVLPTSGVPGTWIAIRGTGLAASNPTTRVLFDDVEATVLVALPGFVLAAVPMGLALGPATLVVERGADQSVGLTFDVVAQATPRIDAVHPSPVVAGALALLRGSDLGTPGNDVSVDFDGVPARHVVALGDRLIVEVPHGAMAGTVTVRVDGVPSEPFNVEIALDPPVPSIDRVTPESASPGSLVQLDGTNFFVPGERVEVYFGGARAALFATDAESLTVVVPPDADPGFVTVRVGDRESDPAAFDLLMRSAPTITEITPSAGAPRDRILIRGIDLFDLSQWRAGLSPPQLDPFGDVDVRFGDVRAWAILPTEDGLAVIVPFRAHTAGVTVTVNGVRSNVVPFTVAEASAP